MIFISLNAYLVIFNYSLQVNVQAMPQQSNQTQTQTPQTLNQTQTQNTSSVTKQAVTATTSLPVTAVKPLNPKSNLEDLKQELDKIHQSSSSHNLKGNLEANLKEIFAPTSSGTVTPAQTISNSATHAQTLTTFANTGVSEVTHYSNEHELQFEGKSVHESFSNDEGIVITINTSNTSNASNQTETTPHSTCSESETPNQSNIQSQTNNQLPVSQSIDENKDKEQSLTVQSNLDETVPVRRLSRFSVTPVRDSSTSEIKCDDSKTDSNICQLDLEQSPHKTQIDIISTTPEAMSKSSHQFSRESSTESTPPDFIDNNFNYSLRNSSSQTSPTQVYIEKI